MKLQSIILSVLILFAFSAKAQHTEHIKSLKFASIEEYENTINNFSEKGLSAINGFDNYISLQSTFKEEVPPAGFDEDETEDGAGQNEEKPADDSKDYSATDALAVILNSDKVVVIGNWIVKINLEKEQAFMLNTKFAEEYVDLLQEKTENRNVLTFKLEEEGVEIMKQLDKGTPEAELRLWCGDRYAQRKRDQKFTDVVNRRRLDMKVVYQRLFIVHSLQGKAKTQKRFLRIWWHDGRGKAQMDYIDLAYDVRCKKDGFYYTGDPCQTGCLSGYSAGSTCKYRPYLGTRSLKNYNYEIHFSSTHGRGIVKISDY